MLRHLGHDRERPVGVGEDPAELLQGDVHLGEFSGDERAVRSVLDRVVDDLEGLPRRALHLVQAAQEGHLDPRVFRGGLMVRHVFHGALLNISLRGRE